MTRGQATFVPLPSLGRAGRGTIPIFMQHRGLPGNPRDLTSRQMWGERGEPQMLPCVRSTQCRPGASAVGRQHGLLPAKPQPHPGGDSKVTATPAKGPHRGIDLYSTVTTSLSQNSQPHPPSPSFSNPSPGFSLLQSTDHCPLCSPYILRA